MTWYGLNFSAEFFVQVCLYGFVILLVLNALNPLQFARRYAILKYKFSKQHKSIRFGVWASLALVAFVVVIFGFPEGAADNSPPKSKFQLFLESSPSAVGDTLAGVAGALAFLWIIITVRLQSSELAKQREELRLTREVMGEQREAAQDMARSMAAQAGIFEDEKRRRDEEKAERYLESLLEGLSKILENLAKCEENSSEILSSSTSTVFRYRGHVGTGEHLESSVERLRLYWREIDEGNHDELPPDVVLGMSRELFSEVLDIFQKISDIEDNLGLDRKQRLQTLQFSELRRHIERFSEEKHIG